MNTSNESWAEERLRSIEEHYATKADLAHLETRQVLRVQQIGLSALSLVVAIAAIIVAAVK